MRVVVDTVGGLGERKWQGFKKIHHLGSTEILEINMFVCFAEP